MEKIKVLFIAGFGPIVRESTTSRTLYSQMLGISFKEGTGGYLHTEALKGANSFFVAAFAGSAVLLWQGFLAQGSSCAPSLARARR
jgi:hypothetical protein